MVLLYFPTASLKRQRDKVSNLSEKCLHLLNRFWQLDRLGASALLVMVQEDFRETLTLDAFLSDEASAHLLDAGHVLDVELSFDAADMLALEV